MAGCVPEALAQGSSFARLAFVRLLCDPCKCACLGALNMLKSMLINLRLKNFEVLQEVINLSNLDKSEIYKMKPEQSEIGQYLRKLRKDKGQTLHQVAKGTDIDSPLISKIERGERIPTAEQIKKFAKYYKVDEAHLKVMAAAGKIIKEYGVSDETYEALSIVMEQITPYLKK